MSAASGAGIDENEFWARLRRSYARRAAKPVVQLDDAGRAARRAAHNAANSALRQRQREALQDFDGRMAEASYPRGFVCDGEAWQRVYTAFWEPRP